MSDSKQDKAYENLADATLKKSVEDYEDLVVHGDMPNLDTIEFFKSDYFDDLCELARISKDKILRYVDTIEIANTPRAKILNWIFDKKHFDGRNKRIIFTSPDSINKTFTFLMKSRLQKSKDFAEGVEFALTEICSEVIFKKFIQKRWIMTNAKNGNKTILSKIHYVVKTIYGLKEIKNITDEQEEVIKKAIYTGEPITDVKGNEWIVSVKFYMNPLNESEAVLPEDENELEIKDDDE